MREGQGMRAVGVMERCGAACLLGMMVIGAALAEPAQKKPIDVELLVDLDYLPL
jgi:hypothetical protein